MAPPGGRPVRTSRYRAFLDGLAAHPWLIGDTKTPGRKLARRVRVLTLVAILAANLVGIAVVVAFAVVVLPKPDGVSGTSAVPVNLALGGAYVLFALVSGVIWGRRLVETGPNGLRAWLEPDLRPTAAQRLRVLRAPLRIMFVQMVLWGLATLLFAGVNVIYSWLLALGVGMTVALGGITTSSAAYVLAELALRPVASRALAAGPVDRRFVPGVALRWFLAWALGTGAAIVGLVAVGIVALTSVSIDEQTLAITVVVLGSTALGFGALVGALAAYATVHPIASIRRGLERVGEGDFEVEVAVWDSTEMGLLQSGFNEMAAGLRERERIRDIFGRQVGREAARQALAVEDPQLGGELCEVAVLFVDVVGSTQLAASRDPRQVVTLLNEFFAEVVEAVDEQGGWVNKFEGDAALAVFGAPTPLPNRAAAALAAARDLDARLRQRVQGLSAAIGVASGTVVAGHVGAESRFEYTVIGDPVNEAARLTELAKEQPRRVLAAGTTVAVGGEEAAHWQLGESVTVRGRSQPTQLGTLRDGAE
ncbi:MAG TPA: adenylate/guanylate cyclase domain-containing protein [Solirubrobacterales bacterium]|nr:adenylate/guanylate cyclase domain-containing protein [Solirubrobacterales bacterium]